MSDPLETITATREQLESAVNEQAVLHAQALARDAVELRDRVFLERESGFRQHADNFVENLRAEHEQEKRLMADAMKALEAKNAELQAAWSASQTQGAQLAQQAQQAQDKFEQLQIAFASQRLAQNEPPSSEIPIPSRDSLHPVSVPGPQPHTLGTQSAPAFGPLSSSPIFRNRQLPSSPASQAAQRPTLRFHPYTPSPPARKQATRPQPQHLPALAAKKKTKMYQLPKDQRPSDLDSGTEAAMRTHFYALTGCLEPNSVVPPPEPHEKLRFLAQFTSSAELSTTPEGPEAPPPDIIQSVQLARRADAKGKRGFGLRFLPDAAVANMQSHCSRRSISRFAPDPYEPHDSLWNEGHCNIWIESFAEALTAQHYSFCNANPKFADPARRGDLRAMYYHIAHYSQAERTRQKVSVPGVTQKRALLDASRRGRERTRDRRVMLATLRRDSPRQIRALQSLRSHSETRRNPTTNELERCAMPHRSAAFTSYLENLDAWGVKHCTLHRLQAIPARKTVPKPPEGLTKWLPQDAPLDFWDVETFNNYPISFRAMILNLWVSLPGDVPYDPKNPAISYPNDRFNDCVGQSIAAKYDIAGIREGTGKAADYAAFLGDDVDHSDDEDHVEEVEMQAMQGVVDEEDIEQR